MVKLKSTVAVVERRPIIVPLWPPIITAAIFLILGVITFAATATANPSDSIRCLLFALIFGIIWIGLQASPKIALSALVAYLCFLGGIRRSLIFDLGWQSLDPLAWVGPAMAMFFFLNMFVSKNITVDTPISKIHLVLICWMFLEIFNPQQGDIAVGASGALVYLIPITWFFVGRTMGTLPATRSIYKAVCVIAMLAAVYGVKQAIFGFSREEIAWINASDMTSLNVGNTIRAFSFFTSSAEYCSCVSIGIVLFWSAFLRGKFLALLPIPLLFLAIVLDSSRGVLVGTLVTMALLFAIQGKSLWTWLPRLIIALSLAAFGLIFCMKLLQSANTPTQAAGLVQHESDGILNPQDENSSTATYHSAMFYKGIGLGFDHPIGIGLGASTDAGKPTNTNYGSTEVDISNMFESLGFAGGALFSVLICIVVLTALSYWRNSRSIESLAIVAVLLVTIGLWLAGKQYSTALIIWFTIGALDRNWRNVYPSRSFPNPNVEDTSIKQIEVESAST